VRDLITLGPDENELAAAERWVQSQDASTEFKHMIREVVAYVQSNGA
jgi:hypothetical protein